MEDEMAKDHLAVLRRPPTSGIAHGSTAVATPRLEKTVRPHPLTILGLATSVRLDDPRAEHERVVMLEIAIVVGREATRALDRWMSRALTEYRGSRSAWDLEATTAELRIKLDEFDRVLRETADRLVALIPGLVCEAPGPVSLSAGATRGRRCLDEVAAVSTLFEAIERAVTLEAQSEPPGRALGAGPRAGN